MNNTNRVVFYMDSVLCEINWHLMYSLDEFVFKRLENCICIKYLSVMLLKVALIKIKMVIK
jgi:hypothetical protein